VKRHPTYAEWEATTRRKRRVAPVRSLAPVVGGAAYPATGTPPWARSQLAGAWLLRLQDTGSLAWRTADVPADIGGRSNEDTDVVVLFRLGFGNGSPVPQQTGAFRLSVNGRPILSFTAVKDRRRWRGHGGELLFSPDLARAAFRPGEGLALDQQACHEAWAAEGSALLRIRRDLVTPGQPVELRIEAAPPVPSATWVRVGIQAFDYEAMACDDALDVLLAPAFPPQVGDRLVLFGDLHNHTGESALPGVSCGRGTRRQALAYARDIAGLDFCCLSEHDWQLADGEWEALQDLNDEWDTPGSFVTIHGYEWTSSSYGHRNVYFPERGGPFVRSADHRSVPDFEQYLAEANARGDDERTPRVLWDSLDRWGGPAITIPHHSSAAMFPLSLEQFFHEGYDRVAEIYSTWGDSLHHHTDRNVHAQRVEDLELARFVDDYPIGFIASSDSHDGHPGNAQGHDHRPHLFHHHGSGQVGVHAAEFTRQAIFDAVHDRRCFALTGGSMVLDVSLNGHPMGANVPADALRQAPVLSVSVDSGAPCREIEVFDGRRLVHVEAARGPGPARFEWEDTAFRGEGTYFVRVTREDGEVAWSSPIRVREASA